MAQAFNSNTDKSEFKANLVYIMNSKTAMSIHRETLSQKRKEWRDGENPSHAPTELNAFSVPRMGGRGLIPPGHRI